MQGTIAAQKWLATICMLTYNCLVAEKPQKIAL